MRGIPKERVKYWVCNTKLYADGLPDDVVCYHVLLRELFKTLFFIVHSRATTLVVSSVILSDSLWRVFRSPWLQVFRARLCWYGHGVKWFLGTEEVLWSKYPCEHLEGRKEGGREGEGGREEGREEELGWKRKDLHHKVLDWVNVWGRKKGGGEREKGERRQGGREEGKEGEGRKERREKGGREEEWRKREERRRNCDGRERIYIISFGLGASWW